MEHYSVPACQDRKTEGGRGHCSQRRCLHGLIAQTCCVDSALVMENMVLEVHLALRSHLQMPSSGSSRPNFSSNVSWILMLAEATSLQTISVLRGYVLGNSGLWTIPSPDTVMIFSWWESWTPGRERKNVCSLLDYIRQKNWPGLNHLDTIELP